MEFIQTEALVDENNEQSLRISDDELDERMTDELVILSIIVSKEVKT